jgi:anti-sigma factor RsiW
MMGPLRGSEPIDQQWLDRLVDGELSEEEERAVIARLADTRDGWQRCAWTFLEHRCWQRAADVMTYSSPTVAAGDRATRVAHARQPWKGTHLLALAAMFLVALGVGMFVPRSPFRLPHRPGSALTPPGPAGSSLAVHPPAEV